MDITQVEKANEEVAALRAQRDKDYAEYEAAGRVWGLVPRERITRIKFPRVSRQIIDGYLSMEDMSTTVSDVLDSYGIDGPSHFLFEASDSRQQNLRSRGNYSEHSGP